MHADTAALRQKYDAVVIGSGLGGLGAAALLARSLGRRVLVLEKHWRLGGQTHQFSRPGGWHWDVGLHYVGELEPGGWWRRVMDFVTGGEVQWRPMPEGYDCFHYPDLSFVARADADRYESDLRARFPGEARALERYFRDVGRAATWLRGRSIRGALPDVMAWAVRAALAPWDGLGLQTTGRWLADHVRDPRLRALLASQWLDYGLPPARSAFAIHALVVDHYLRGAFYPAGGAQTIPFAAQRVIEARGGRCLVGAEALRILVHRGRARGVRVRMHREEFEVEAPVVISDAGAHLTYRRLLDAPLFAELDRQPRALSSLSLYTGLTDSPASIGMDGANHWIYDAWDHDALADAELDQPVRHVYVSFPSIKGGFEPHTAELITFVGYDAFARWKDAPWKKRGRDYEALKERLASEMLDLAERRLPGLKGLVAYRELSTPLSIETFTSRERGLMYGVPATPERFRMRCLGTRTPIAGLYLSGTDVVAVGILAALVGGVAAAASASGPRGAARILASIRRPGSRAASPASPPVVSS